MKIAKYLFLAAVVALVSVGFTSCNGYSSKAAEKMSERYSDGDMTKDDFSKCIDWVEKCYEDYEKEFESIINEAKNEKKFKKLYEEKIEDKFEDKWENIDDIIKLLNEAAYEEDKSMGSSNIKRWEKVNEKHNKKMEKLYEKGQKKFDKD